MKHTTALAALFALSACGSQPDNAVMPAPEPSASAPEPAASPTDLSAYVGKYPFDKVDGVAFVDNPQVRAAVERAAGGAIPASTFFTASGPATPIAMQDGRILSWACEEHNCGPHNWSMAVAPDGSTAQLCYHDDKATPPTIRIVEGKTTPQSEDCPSGDG